MKKTLTPFKAKGYKTKRLAAALVLLLSWTACADKALAQAQEENRPLHTGGLRVHLREVPLRPETRVLYSWSLRDADIHDALLSFAKGSETNIVVEPGVEGKVTVDLNSVEFDMVLEYLLAPLGLDYSRTDNVVRVFKPPMQTKLFQLDYVNSRREGKGSVSINSGSGENIQSASSASIENNTTTDFWGTLIDALNIIIFEEKGSVEPGPGGAFSKKDEKGRKLIVNPLSGVLMVTADKDKLRETEEFIKAIQLAIQRQVLIQAKIVEVTLSDDFEMGINWSHVADFPEWTRLSGTISSSAAGIKSGAAFAQAVLPDSASGVFQMGVSSKKNSVLLDAMAKQGTLNLLSSPQVVTLNNQTAMIKVTQESVYFEVSTSVISDTNTTVESVESKTVDVGIVLDVTPQISEQGSITLNIHPSISEIAGEAVSRLGDTRPIIDRRESNAVVKVKDGQTIVMAGLMKEKSGENLRKVPCLGDIPFLGALFRHTVQEKKKVELVIMLTPIILDEGRIDKVRQIKERDVEELRPNLHLGLPNLPEAGRGEPGR